MRNREDMNKYNTASFQAPAHRTEGEFSKAAGATVKTMGGMLWKAVKTLFWVGVIAGVLVFLSVMAFIFSFRNTVPPDIATMSLNYSSYIYTVEPDGSFSEHLVLHSSEDRKWASLTEIPKAMQTAQICIEDHRFYEHKGVDWKGTLGAVATLVTGAEGRGGSTLTQQLIKNITGEKQVSVLRKIKEIFTALNLEGGYTDENGDRHEGCSKDEILQAYLNVVNYGGQCQGVEAAARRYFDKDIGDCTLAECALIAGITQNPSAFNPILHPEAAKNRAGDVLYRMRELSKNGEITDPRLIQVTQSEYDAAVAELETMTFVGAELDSGSDAGTQADADEWNWYDEVIFEKVVEGLQERWNYSREQAVHIMYNGGLKIYSSQNVAFQKDIENLFLTNTAMLPEDEAIELGFYMLDPYTGRIMAVVGSRGEKHGKRIANYATGYGDIQRQSGSAIKPISPYIVGLENGTINYSTVLKDQPFPEEDIYGKDYPKNFDRQYTKYMNVDLALEKSQNAPAAWLCREVTPESCYSWLTDQLKFSTLTEEDSHSIAAMSLGGQSWGVTVEDMTAAYQIFANGGVYHEPMAYYYVEDHDGAVILDNRNDPGEQVISPESATIMNKLLHQVVYGKIAPTAWQVADMDVEIFGKTGTTDDSCDLWFIGATPFCVAGVWHGYEIPSELDDSTIAKTTWRGVIQHLLDNYNWSDQGWVLSSDVTEHRFCRNSGKLAGPNCFSTSQGWYASGNIPGTCNGGSDHIFGDQVSPSPSVVPSAAPSPSPSVSPSPSAAPSIEPTPGVTPDVSGVESSDPGIPTPTPDVSTVEPTAEPTTEPTPEPTPGPAEPLPPSSSNIEFFEPNVPTT